MIMKNKYIIILNINYNKMIMKNKYIIILNINYNKMITKYKLFESKNEVFEIGTKVICSDGNQDDFEVGGLIGIIQQNHSNGNGRVNGIRKTNELSYCLYFKEDDNKGRFLNEYWWAHHSLVHLYGTDIQEIEKQRLEKMEQLRLKYKDIDPLGEENWEDEED